MKLFEKKKIGNKRIIKILGIKISYKVKRTKKAQGLSHVINNRLLNFYMARLNPENKKWYMRQLFYSNVHYFPDFDRPRTFNEKIHWLKLYYHNPLITKCCDKYAVKEYVKEVLGEGYTVPTIAAWNNVNEIDFDALPEKFALKVNWSSGYNIIVKDKAKLDVNSAKAKISQWMQPWNNSYYVNFNWGYKNMKPVIYAEQYIEQADGQVYDYKFFCYNGEPKNLYVATDRFSDKRFTYFDINWNHLPFAREAKMGDPGLPKPKHFDEMIKLARKLAQPFPFVRVDFYEIGDRVFVGEMTFYPSGGIYPFEPQEWDFAYGDMIQLPSKMLEDGE